METTKYPSEKVDLAYRTCHFPAHTTCDGIRHYWAAWDEDLCRWMPVDSSCPRRHRNRAIDAYDRFRDDGMSHHAALALVRAHGGDL